MRYIMIRPDGDPLPDTLKIIDIFPWYEIGDIQQHC